MTFNLLIDQINRFLGEISEPPWGKPHGFKFGYIKTEKEIKMKIYKLIIKNLLLTIVLTANLNASNKEDVIFHKLGIQEWQDKYDRPAPPQFRQAADRLWDAVGDEDSMRCNAGWVKERKLSYEETWERRGCCANIVRVFCCPCSCGIAECVILSTTQKSQEFEGNFEWNDLHRQGKRSKYDAQLDIKVQFTNRYMEEYRTVLNKSVTNPINYSGDMNLEIDQTYIDYPDWTEWNDIKKRYFMGGRRNLFGLWRNTLNFVNSHGGWMNEESPIFVMRQEGDVMIIDMKK